MNKTFAVGMCCGLVVGLTLGLGSLLVPGEQRPMLIEAVYGP